MCGKGKREGGRRLCLPETVCFKTETEEEIKVV
jgi:hypothetical protein